MMLRIAATALCALCPEAQSEVVSSQVLWAIGFHQPVLKRPDDSVPRFRNRK
jgi:hypothetical protein